MVVRRGSVGELTVAVHGARVSPRNTAEFRKERTGIFCRRHVGEEPTGSSPVRTTATRPIFSFAAFPIRPYG